MINWRTRLAVLSGVTLAGTGLVFGFIGLGAGAVPFHLASSGSAAAARSGDNGTVKIHRSTTPITDPRNEPHVCVFYLDAFGFDPGQAVSWQIKSWPPTGDRSVVSSGVLTLDGSGNGDTANMTLPDGHYKLYWNFAGEKGFAKQKVFWVACGASTPSPTPTPSQTPTESQTPTPTPSQTATASSTPTASATPTASTTPSSS
jgi:hypothetical protein